MHFYYQNLVCACLRSETRISMKILFKCERQPGFKIRQDYETPQLKKTVLSCLLKSLLRNDDDET